MSRKVIIRLAMLAALVAAVFALAPRIDFYMLTGSFSPIHQIETLKNPVAVTRWSSDGLKLADGRTVQLSELRALPNQSVALAEATKRGVEIGADGRVWGLVKVHHWCGNDPVREHIARVDLAAMMIFLRVAEPVVPIRETDLLITEPGGRFTEWGWNVSEFFHFQSWQSIKDLNP